MKCIEGWPLRHRQYRSGEWRRSYRRVSGLLVRLARSGDLIDRPSPALLSLFHGLPRGIPGFGLDVVLGHRKLYGLTRTRERFRCLEVGNRLSRSLTALTLFAFRLCLANVVVQLDSSY